jgi:hypothetical protein
MHHECKEPLGKGLPHQGPRAALFQCESMCSTSRLSIELTYFQPRNLTRNNVETNLPLNLPESDTTFSAVPWSLRCGCWMLRGSKTQTNTKLT